MFLQILSKITGYLQGKKELSCILTNVIYSLLLYVFPGNFKFAALLSIFFLLLLYGITRNFLLSIFSVIFLSGQFLWIGKYYEFELVSPYEYVFERFSGGIIEQYGLNLSDLFSFGLAIFFLKEIFQNRFIKGKKNHTKSLSFSKKILIFWSLFFLIAMYSSYYISFKPVFSLSILWQQFKLVLSFIATIKLLKSDSRTTKYFYLTIMSLLIFQSFLGLFQFFWVLLGFGANQQFNYSFVVPEEESLIFPRVFGTFLHPNDFSFVLLKLIFILFTHVFIISKTKAFKRLLILSFFILLLAQSRVIWLGLLGTLLFFGWEFRKKIRFQISDFMNRKFFFSVLLLICISVLLVFPRVYLSQFFLDEEGGGNLRLKMISEGMQVILQRPLFGYGIETNLRVMFDNFPNGYVQNFPFTVHNMYIRMVSEVGIIATICFFIPFVLIIRKYLQIKRNLSYRDRLNLFFIVACAFSSLIYYLFQPANGRIDYLYLGIVFGFGSFFIENYEKKHNKRLQ